jgi:protein FAM50
LPSCEKIGLVTKEEFVHKRNTLQERLEEEIRQQHEEKEAAIARDKEKKRQEKAAKSNFKLSFLGGDDEGDGEEEAEEKAGPSFVVPLMKKPRIGKDPSAPLTEALPDKDREEQEEQLRMQIKNQYLAEQARIKAEELEITYSYWDGSGHRRSLKVKKGDTIGHFLKCVRDQLGPEFREMRGVSVDNLMYVKEDIILPQNMSFYDLIKSKARGKSGPLFEFSVVEDVRLKNDATKEKKDSHAGKVVERHWFEQHKHQFPANRWEPFDPEKKWDSYSIHDRNEKH